MFPIFIALTIVIVGLTYMRVTNNRRKKALQNFNIEIEYKNAPVFMANLCSHELIEVKIQMKELPIDAITQCVHIDLRENEPAEMAMTTVKATNREVTAVKTNYHITQHVCYLVLSGKELHYLFYEEGDIKEHFVLKESYIQNARLATVSGLDGLMKTRSISGKKLHKLLLKVDTRSMEILFYETITDAPEGALYEKNTFVLQAKNAVVGKYFLEQLKARYPLIYSSN